MPYPRLGTPAGDRAVASAQRAYDNMTPDDEPEPEPVMVACSGYDKDDGKCNNCAHDGIHELGDDCPEDWCHERKIAVMCEEV